MATETTFDFGDNWELIEQWFGGEEPGIIIMEAVESYDGLSATETPLYEHIDTDVPEEPSRPVVEDEKCSGVEVRFPCEDVQATITSTGDIFAHPAPEHILS